MEEIISIIVPMYNAQEFIERCIKSVINQTCNNWELILINDGSKDLTENICNKFTNNKKIYLFNKKNTGVSDSRNVGIKKSKGKWITFLDADDELEENYVENTLKRLRNDKYDILIGEIDTSLGQNFKIKDDVIYWNKNKEKLIKNMLTSKNNNKNYNSQSLGYVIGKIYKKDLIKNIKFPENITYREDMIFNIQAFIKARKILITNCIAYKHIINTKSVSFKYVENYLDEIKRFNNILKKIIKKSKLNLKEDFYTCMINMYINWLKLSVMHKKSKLSIEEKRQLINQSFSDIFWIQIFTHVNFIKLTSKYKILYILYKFKKEKLIYKMVNLNIIKNEKIYNV